MLFSVSVLRGDNYNVYSDGFCIPWLPRAIVKSCVTSKNLVWARQCTEAKVGIYTNEVRMLWYA